MGLAVMERLNLHDALVRIPMNHGDLGPSSQVGHADHSCSSRMNRVPLSDFFASASAERESQMGLRRARAALWMVDFPIAAGGDRSRRRRELGTEERCAIGTDPNPNEPGSYRGEDT